MLIDITRKKNSVICNEMGLRNTGSICAHQPWLFSLKLWHLLTGTHQGPSRIEYGVQCFPSICVHDTRFPPRNTPSEARFGGAHLRNPCLTVSHGSQNTGHQRRMKSIAPAGIRSLFGDVEYSRHSVNQSSREQIIHSKFAV